MMDKYVLIFVISFIAAMFGSVIGHRLKGVKRSNYAMLAVHLVSTFGASILVLIVISQLAWHPFVVSPAIGLWYGFFMANAKAFSSIT